VSPSSGWGKSDGEINANHSHDGRRSFRIIVHDITQVKLIENQYQMMLFYDLAHTGLANRALFIERLTMRPGTNKTA